MKTRIFKFDNYYNYYNFNCVSNDEIRFIDVSEIQKGYNLYGYLRLDENFKENLEEYRAERNEAFEEFKKENENYMLEDVKDFLEDFIDDYEYDTSFYDLAYNRPKKWVDYEDEESIFGESDLDNFRDIEGDEVDKSINVCEYIEEWDGSNLQTIYLTADWFDTNIEEITDEYEGIEDRWVEIYSDRWGSGGRDVKYDEETDTMWIYEWSAYQGTTSFYKIADYEDRLTYTINSINDPYADTPQSLFDEVLDEFNKHTKQGEEVYYDTDSFCLEYRGEQYHFITDEIFHEGFFGKKDYIDLNQILDIARDAIEKRRKEAITERFAQQNYKLIDTLPLSKIFVEFEDSIEAGNCLQESKALEQEIAGSEDIQGKYACRADLILEYRDDNYSRRAILNAYRNHYVKIS